MGVDRYGVGRGLEMAAPLAKDPHLGPPCTRGGGKDRLPENRALSDAGSAWRFLSLHFRGIGNNLTRMGGFFGGLVAGLVGAGMVSAVAGVWVYRRLMALQRRTRHAERLAELGVLTGGLAHEIRNPLSTVQLNLQLLAEELESEDGEHNRLLPRLATVQSETSRLRDILDDFLRYAGKIELSRCNVDLHQLLVEMSDFFAPQAQLNHVRLRLADSSQKVMASVDGRLVRQAVLNLMINANQAMTNGGEMILRASRGDGHALIDVIDTGPGIEPAEIDRIFQAYYSRKAGGSGLGLAMTRRIVEEHGGQVTVQSEIGKGTDFTLHFPVKKEMPDKVTG